jgi:hypothetical protein
MIIFFAISPSPSWDLTEAPYEPIADADLRSLSLKTAFLLALCSARRVGELCAHSVSDDCLRWMEGGTSVSLWPNPAFLPKVVNRQSINQVLEVDAFQPASASQAEQDRLLTLWTSEGLESLPDPYTATKGSTLPTFRLLRGSKEGHTSFEAEAVPLVGRRYFPCLQSKRDACPA